MRRKKMKVLQSASLDLEISCHSCQSRIVIEPQDWKYVKAYTDPWGFSDPECLVANCAVCNQQISIEEYQKGMRGIFNAIKKRVKG